METKAFDTIYQKVPRHQVDELLEFRSTHPIQQRAIDHPSIHQFSVA
jgi:hypothetical protein